MNQSEQKEKIKTDDKQYQCGKKGINSQKYIHQRKLQTYELIEGYTAQIKQDNMNYRQDIFTRPTLLS